MHALRTSVLVATAVMVLGGCGGDGGTGPGATTPLTRAEITDLVSTLAGSIVTDVVASASDAGTITDVAMRTVATSVAANTAETVACPGGGSVVVTLAVNGASASVQHRGCKATGESGQIWTMDGDPSLNVRFGVGSLGPSTSGIGLGMTGAVRASRNGKSSRCAMDLSITPNFTPAETGMPAFHWRMTGTACGVTVDETF